MRAWQACNILGCMWSSLLPIRYRPLNPGSVGNWEILSGMINANLMVFKPVKGDKAVALMDLIFWLYPKSSVVRDANPVKSGIEYSGLDLNVRYSKCVSFSNVPGSITLISFRFRHSSVRLTRDEKSCRWSVANLFQERSSIVSLIKISRGTSVKSLLLRSMPRVMSIVRARIQSQSGNLKLE